MFLLYLIHLFNVIRKSILEFLEETNSSNIDKILLNVCCKNVITRYYYFLIEIYSIRVKIFLISQNIQMLLLFISFYSERGINTTWSKCLNDSFSFIVLKNVIQKIKSYLKKKLKTTYLYLLVLCLKTLIST